MVIFRIPAGDNFDIIGLPRVCPGDTGEAAFTVSTISTRNLSKRVWDIRRAEVDTDNYSIVEGLVRSHLAQAVVVIGDR